MLDINPCHSVGPTSFGPPPISSGMEKQGGARLDDERHACQSLRKVLQLKLQQRRTREELVSQGIMPPLKSPAAFHRQRRSLERAKTEDYLKRRICSRPGRAELVRMHILEETLAEPCLQAMQLQLKRARLADNLNDKISQRPGPMELIHKNILPVTSSLKQAIIETDFQKVGGENSSCEDDSSDALSPDQLPNQDSPFGSATPSPPIAQINYPSPTQLLHQVPPSPPPLPLPNHALANGRQKPVAKSQGRVLLDRTVSRSKKQRESKPKVRKLKYHQYIPPDQKAGQDPPPQLDSAYAKILQQQQLYLQLQIISQQQQHYNYHTILPAPPKPSGDQQSSTNTGLSPSRTAPNPHSASTNQDGINRGSTTPVDGHKSRSLPANLDELKVAELKQELKVRGLTVSGTKIDLIGRLKNHQEQNGRSSMPSTAEGSVTPPVVSSTPHSSQSQPDQPSDPTLGGAADLNRSTSLVATVPLETVPNSTLAPVQMMQLDSTSSSAPDSPILSDHSLCGSPERGCSSDVYEEMVSSPLTQLHLRPSPPPAPVDPVKSVHSSPGHLVSIASPLDKDRMLQEKDQRIQELTRMLQQKQQLVEVLQAQLQGRSLGGLKVKEEPPDGQSSVTADHPLSPDKLLLEVSVKQEANEVVKEEEQEKEKVDRKETPVPHQNLQNRKHQRSMENPQTHSLLKQQSQQNPNNQSPNKNNMLKQQILQNPKNQIVLKPNEQNPNNPNVLKQQILQNPKNQSLRNPKNQSLLNPINQSLLNPNNQILQNPKNQSLQNPNNQILQNPKNQSLQNPNNQILQNPKNQSLLNPKNQSLQNPKNQSLQNQHMQQQRTACHQDQQQQRLPSQQVSQVISNQQSCSTPSLPLDVLKSHPQPTLFTDSNGNHFLVALTNHRTESQSNSNITLKRLMSMPTKLPSQSTLQIHNPDAQSKQLVQTRTKMQPVRKGQKLGFQVSTNQITQEHLTAATAPPSLQPFFPDAGPTPSSDHTHSPSNSTEMGTTQQNEDLFDILIKNGDISANFRPTHDHTLSRVRPNTPFSSSPCPHSASPLSLPTPYMTQEPSRAETHDSDTDSGRLEDFLESTTGKPLFGVEPDGPLTLIDDLHGQLLSTASILDHPSSPMDTCESLTPHPPGLGLGEPALDSMDWLDMGFGSARGRDFSGPQLLNSHTGSSLFSTDFLDSPELQLQWDACL